MSEHQAALAHNAMPPQAVAAKPRISADAFRNLTARLKKTDIAIPDLMPVAAPQPVVRPQLVEIVAEAPLVIQPEPQISIEAVAEVSPVVAAELEPIFDLPLIEPVAAPIVVEAAPDVQSGVEVELAPLQAEPVVETMGIEAALAALPESPVVPDFEPSLPNVASHGEGTEPSEIIEEPVLAAPVPVDLEALFDIAPVEVAAVAEVAPIDVVAVEEPASLAPEATPAEPQLQGSFAENFTYVPEGGKAAAAEEVSDAPVQVDLGDLDDAVKKEVAERATQLELENNWRLLLAKPTPEDRATYLREAAEYHEGDDAWNKPDPEHDLSRITPADVDIVETTEIEAPEGPGALQRSLQDNLPVAEGQDLAELTRSLLDMMAAGNASGLPQERALAADTLLRLVPRLELKPLVMLAQRLSMMDNPPHLLAARLIRDPRVEVAGPLLEDCAHLTDRDLETVVHEGEPAKLRMIARRRKLTRPISDALIKSGDPSVVLTLVRNMEAEISHDGFQSLLVLCENNDELLAPLATRHDMQAPFAFELFWLAPAQLRRFILSRFLTDSETLTKILKITMATQSEDESEVEPLSQHALLEALERAARGHIGVAAEELSGIMQLSSATVTRILSDVQGDAIVVMLKAAGYPRSAVTGLLKRMQDADLPLVTRERDIGELQSMFETLSFNKARILLTYWDWAQGKTGPYATVQ